MSYRQGKRNNLIIFTLGSIACSLFSDSVYKYAIHVHVGLFVRCLHSALHTFLYCISVVVEAKIQRPRMRPRSGPSKPRPRPGLSRPRPNVCPRGSWRPLRSALEDYITVLYCRLAQVANNVEYIIC